MDTLGQMSDPGDLIGLMQKNIHTGHSEFLPPYWWPQDHQPIVLFLDELNRARPEILQSIMDLTLNRKLAGKSLPEKSIVISAINEGDAYQLTDLDPALVSRFNVYEFAPTVEDWLVWAHASGLDPRVIQFIQKYPAFLDTAHELNVSGHLDLDMSLKKKPDRRSWERVANLIREVDMIDDMYMKIIAGIVGIAASVHFKQSVGEQVKLDIEKVLFQFDTQLFNRLQLQDYILANEQIIHYLNVKKFNSVKKGILLENLKKYIKFLKTSNFQEAVAHFATQLENPHFEYVLGLVFSGSDELMQEISEYIQGIDL